MNISKEALLERGFREQKPDEDGEYYSRLNGTWNHHIKVSFYNNGAVVVDLVKYEHAIPSFGCKTLEDIDHLIRLFIG